MCYETGVSWPPSDDRAVLVKLYNGTDGPNWVNNTGWMSDEPLSSWFGVNVDSLDRVVGLDLSGK